MESNENRIKEFMGDLYPKVADWRERYSSISTIPSSEDPTDYSYMDILTDPLAEAIVAFQRVQQRARESNIALHNPIARGHNTTGNKSLSIEVFMACLFFYLIGSVRDLPPSTTEIKETLARTRKATNEFIATICVDNSQAYQTALAWENTPQFGMYTLKHTRNIATRKRFPALKEVYACLLYAVFEFIEDGIDSEYLDLNRRHLWRSSISEYKHRLHTEHLIREFCSIRAIKLKEYEIHHLYQEVTLDLFLSFFSFVYAGPHSGSPARSWLENIKNELKKDSPTLLAWENGKTIIEIDETKNTMTNLRSGRSTQIAARTATLMIEMTRHGPIKAKNLFQPEVCGFRVNPEQLQSSLQRYIREPLKKVTAARTLITERSAGNEPALYSLNPDVLVIFKRST